MYRAMWSASPHRVQAAVRSVGMGGEPRPAVLRGYPSRSRCLYLPSQGQTTTCGRMQRGQCHSKHATVCRWPVRALGPISHRVQALFPILAGRAAFARSYPRHGVGYRVADTWQCTVQQGGPATRAAPGYQGLTSSNPHLAFAYRRVCLSLSKACRAFREVASTA